ncbi:hypothetical protein J6590_009035 [Homalodisca vitripennis]|nr:hypothetical protein J6590_009035 [Homalodisca vitripennis]
MPYLTEAAPGSCHLEPLLNTPQSSPLQHKGPVKQQECLQSPQRFMMVPMIYSSPCINPVNKYG